MLLKRMQPYWRNILKNKKIFTGNYYICKKIAMILIVLIVFTGCGQNRITEKEEKKETVESCDNQIDMVNREKVEEFCKAAEKEEQAAVDIVQPNRDSLQY